MALYQNDAAKGIIGAPYPSTSGEVVAKRFTYAVPDDIALNDIIEMAPIPVGTRVLDMILDSDDLDSDGAPAMDIDVGIMSGDFGDDDAARTCGDEFFDGDSTVQAGGTARPTLKTAFRTGVANNQRSIGVKVATAAATGQAGTIGLTVFYAAE